MAVKALGTAGCGARSARADVWARVAAPRLRAFEPQQLVNLGKGLALLEQGQQHGSVAACFRGLRAQVAARATELTSAQLADAVWSLAVVRAAWLSREFGCIVRGFHRRVAYITTAGDALAVPIAPAAPDRTPL